MVQDILKIKKEYEAEIMEKTYISQYLESLYNSILNFEKLGKTKLTKREIDMINFSNPKIDVGLTKDSFGNQHKLYVRFKDSNIKNHLLEISSYTYGSDMTLIKSIAMGVLREIQWDKVAKLSWEVDNLDEIYSKYAKIQRDLESLRVSINEKIGNIDRSKILTLRDSDVHWSMTYDLKKHFELL